MRVGVAVVLAVGLAVGCVSSAAEVCSDGSLCPANTQCDVDNNRCLTQQQLEACADKPEGADCFYGEAGSCHAGACDPWYCGDNRVTAGEACDGTDLGQSTMGGKNTCIDAGYYSAAGLACKATCVFDTSACTGGKCGDGMINGPELCDGATNRTCISIGFDAGSVSCNNQCGFQIRDCTRIGWNPESLNGLVALALGGSGPDDQWAAGTGGRVMRFEGAFWNPVPTPVTNNLLAVSALTTNDAWMVGIKNTSPLLPAVILHWDGLTWSQVTAPGASYVDIYAAAAGEVFAASNDLGIQGWDGTTWREVGPGMITGTPIAIRGTAADDLWVATDEGPLWHWNGATWTSQSAILPNAKLRFLDANSRTDVWGIGSDEVSPSNGVIAHYNGTLWETWRTNGEIYNNIASSGPKDTWVAGADDSMHHYDGVAWASTLPIGASPSGLAAISGLQSFGANEVVAVSTLNLAYRFRGLAFGRYPQLPVFTENLAQWGDRADDLYVGNVDGDIYHYDGADWQRVFQLPPGPLGSNVPVRALWGYSGNDVWVGDTDGRVFHFNGAAWTDLISPATTRIDVIWGTSASDTWAFGAAGAFHWDGGAWRRDAFANANVRSVAGTATDDIWAVLDSSPRSLWHYDGTTWMTVDTMATRQVNAVAAPARDLVFVAADSGRIEHYNGTTWTEDVVPSVAELAYMASTATDDVIAASERELFHYDGHQWSPMRPPVDFVPNTPDYVPMRGIQAFPGRIDMLLQRLKIRTLLRTRPIACRTSEKDDCNNGIDDDCDGKIDQTDDDCP
jgi:hypothetical protein